MELAPAALCSLVGAGPGHPGLLTLRGAECLRQADLVLYDKLAPAALLELAPTAEKVCISTLGEEHPQRQAPIHETMIRAARAGKRVVRLKGGDPCLFGRGGEEAEALLRAGIPFEIVPGVTAALGAAAFAGIPLTHRRLASAVAFVTGHENPDKTEVAIDWAALARFSGTLVFYMGMSRLQRIARTLIGHGFDPNTPAAVVQQATTGAQQTLTAPLHVLAERARAEGLTAPAVIVIGRVVALRQELAWFEQRPLFGRRILVTRPRHQAGELVERLVEMGALPFMLPAVEIRPIDDWGPVDRALRTLATYHWLVFTSANGVHALLGRLPALGLDLRVLGSVQLACIGPRTAEALEQYHLRPDYIPQRYQSEDLAAGLKAVLRPGQRVLLARADRGRELLREQLAEVCTVEQVAVYRQVDAVDADEAVLGALRRGEIDYITLTSSNIARSLLSRLDATCRGRLERGEVQLVTISPVTSTEVARLSLPVAAEAGEATVTGLITALTALAQRETSRSAHLPEGVPGQVHHQGAGEQGHDIDGPVQAAEGNLHDDVEQE
jgi:uroporphyrinogen III methyltransferase/synthase